MLSGLNEVYHLCLEAETASKYTCTAIIQGGKFLDVGAIGLQKLLPLSLRDVRAEFLAIRNAATASAR